MDDRLAALTCLIGALVHTPRPLPRWLRLSMLLVSAKLAHPLILRILASWFTATKRPPDPTRDARLAKAEQRFKARAEIRRVIFLGTGSACPAPDKRNTSALALMLSTGGHVLIDCGEATQHQIMRSTSVKMPRIDAICITHLHGDHCFGLPGLLCSMAMQGRAAPLIIVGPRGLKNMVRTAIDVQSGTATFTAFELHFVELDGRVPPPAAGIPLPGQMRVYPIRLKHVLGLETFGYIVAEAPKPARTFDPRMAFASAEVAASELSRAQMKQLRDGTDVVLQDGRHISAETCKPAPHVAPAGKRVAIFQDTCDSLGSPDLSTVDPVTMLIHEATFENALEDKAIQYGHATPRLAMQCAERMGAETLVLTHFSGRMASAEPSLFQLGPVGDDPTGRRRVRSSTPNVASTKMKEEALAATRAKMDVVVARDFLVLAYGDENVIADGKKRRMGASNANARKRWWVHPFLDFALPAPLNV